MKDKLVILAEIIVRAFAIHEDSYDQIASDKTSNETTITGMLCIDYSKFYTKTMDESIREAMVELDDDDRYFTLVDVLLFTASNDALDWANNVINKEKK